MPRYDLPKASDGSEQWIELKDRDEITRRELRATRLAYDTEGGFIEKREVATETVIAHCLKNWQLKTGSDDVRMPQRGNVKQIQQYCEALPADTWFAIERVVNGDPKDPNDGGYVEACLAPVDGEDSPSQPSTD